LKCEKIKIILKKNIQPKVASLSDFWMILGEGGAEGGGYPERRVTPVSEI